MAQGTTPPWDLIYGTRGGGKAKEEGCGWCVHNEIYGYKVILEVKEATGTEISFILGGGAERYTRGRMGSWGNGRGRVGLQAARGVVEVLIVGFCG